MIKVCIVRQLVIIFRQPFSPDPQQITNFLLRIKHGREGTLNCYCNLGKRIRYKHWKSAVLVFEEKLRLIYTVPNKFKPQDLKFVLVIYKEAKITDALFYISNSKVIITDMIITKIRLLCQ